MANKSLEKERENASAFPAPQLQSYLFNEMKRLIVLILFSSILLSCVCVPLGTETKSVTVVASSAHETIEKHFVHQNFVVIASSEGFFVDSYIKKVEYWLRSDEDYKKLKHLSGLNPGYTLEEIFNMNNTNVWVAFVLENVERKKVDIKLVIFDNRSILNELHIKNCKRFDTCAEHFRNVKSYGIKPKADATRLVVETIDKSIEIDIMVVASAVDI